MNRAARFLSGAPQSPPSNVSGGLPDVVGSALETREEFVVEIGGVQAGGVDEGEQARRPFAGRGRRHDRRGVSENLTLRLGVVITAIQAQPVTARLAQAFNYTII